MLVCRKRDDYAPRYKISAAFNVSQRDPAPLNLFQRVLRCGSLRKAGNGGWYWEVNRLPELAARIVPFFDRFPVVGEKAEDYRLWRSAVAILAAGCLSDDDYIKVLALREGMNRGGKRRYRMNGILRDYTPGSSTRASTR